MSKTMIMKGVVKEIDNRDQMTTTLKLEVNDLAHKDRVLSVWVDVNPTELFQNMLFNQGVDPIGHSTEGFTQTSLLYQQFIDHEIELVDADQQVRIWEEQEGLTQYEAQKLYMALDPSEPDLTKFDPKLVLEMIGEAEHQGFDGWTEHDKVTITAFLNDIALACSVTLATKDKEEPLKLVTEQQRGFDVIDPTKEV